MINLPNGYNLQNRYQILNYINSDSIGIRYKAINIGSGQIVIIKEIFLQNICIRGKNYTVLSKKQDKSFYYYKQNLLNEVGLLKLLNQPNIVKSLEFIEENNTIYSIEEHIENAIRLDRYRENFGDKEATKFLKDISNGLLSMHNSQTIHRNIKPSNTLYIDGRFILSDFSSIKKFKKSNTIFTDIGDKFYGAPEQFKVNGKIGEATDIYAMGATLFTLLTAGKTQDINKREDRKYQVLYESIFRSNIKRLEIREDLKNIILKMLQFDYSKRYQNLKELKEDIDKLKNLYLLKLRVEPSNANIKFINSKINYHENLQLEEGIYTVVISKRGFINQKIEVELKKDKTVNIRLKKSYRVIYILSIVMFLVVLMSITDTSTEKRENPQKDKPISKNNNTTIKVDSTQTVAYIKPLPQNVEFGHESTEIKKWDEANNYCKSFNEKLPTINELRTLEGEIKDKQYWSNMCYIKGVFEGNCEVGKFNKKGNLSSINKLKKEEFLVKCVKQ